MNWQPIVHQAQPCRRRVNVVCHPVEIERLEERRHAMARGVERKNIDFQQDALWAIRIAANRDVPSPEVADLLNAFACRRTLAAVAAALVGVILE